MRAVRPVAALVAALLTALAVAVTGLAAPAAAADGTLVRLTFTTKVSSAGTTLESMPGGHVYGWNDLRGTTTWAGKPTDVRFLGDVDYVDGSGPFNGYVTLTRSDGVRLGLRVEGSSLSVAAGEGTSRAHFTGQVTVIQGTGRFRGAQGNGTMVGYRAAALGSPVEMTFSLRVLTR